MKVRRRGPIRVLLNQERLRTRRALTLTELAALVLGTLVLSVPWFIGLLHLIELCRAVLR